MQHSPSPSTTERRRAATPTATWPDIAHRGLAVALGALALAAGACSDPATCGAGDAPADGIALTGAGLEVRYTGLRASQNNDCNPTSITLQGTQVGATSRFTLCIRDPDQLAGTPTTLGVGVEVVDVRGAVGDCTVTLDGAGAPPSGSASAAGLCDGGVHPDGFALSLDGEVSITRTCTGMPPEALRVKLAGRAAIAGQAAAGQLRGP